MFFHFNDKSSILLFFFLNGWVLTLLLLIKSYQKRELANLFLALFIFLATLYITPFMLGYAGWYSEEPYRQFLFYAPLQHLFWIPPVLFLYVRSLLDRSFRLSWKHGLHFLPGAFYLFYILGLWVIDGVSNNETGFYADGRDKDLDPWYQVTGFFFLVYYSVRSVREYFRYLRLTYESVSFADRIRFRWLRFVLFLFLLLMVLRILFFLLNPEWGQFGSKYWYYLCFSVVAYLLGIIGYGNSMVTPTSFDVFSEKSNAAPTQHEEEESAQPDNLLSTSQTSPDPALEAIRESIIHFMENKKGYEDPMLTVTDLSRAINIHPKKISFVINKSFGKNFNDYVNGFRVQAVIDRIGLGKHDTQTLMGLAYDAGFNSKSTFLRAFKKETGLNPSEFVRKKGSNPDLGRLDAQTD